MIKSATRGKFSPVYNRSHNSSRPGQALAPNPRNVTFRFVNFLTPANRTLTTGAIIFRVATTGLVFIRGRGNIVHKIAVANATGSRRPTRPAMVKSRVGRVVFAVESYRGARIKSARALLTALKTDSATDIFHSRRKGATRRFHPNPYISRAVASPVSSECR